MYFRIKSGGFEYLQMVESHRVNGKPRQTVVATLGRLDALKESGELESGMLLSAFEKGETTTIDAKRIGPALLADRKFEFLVERTIFLTVLHRIMDPGSDRAAEKWRAAYSIGGMNEIDLHHLYRAMSWRGEELADQKGRGLVPRTNKDLIEEQLFAKRRNLFNDVALAIFDTTSLYFEGEGGKTLGRKVIPKTPARSASDGPRRRHRRDPATDRQRDVARQYRRRDDAVARLRERLMLNRVCVIAARGMVSAKTIATLEAHKIEYILGVRQRGAGIRGGYATTPLPVWGQTMRT